MKDTDVIAAAGIALVTVTGIATVGIVKLIAQTKANKKNALVNRLMKDLKNDLLTMVENGDSTEEIMNCYNNRMAFIHIVNKEG